MISSAPRRDLPAHHRQAEVDAFALVTDPPAAAAASAGARRLAWCILMSARGKGCNQFELIRDAARRGLR